MDLSTAVLAIIFIAVVRTSSPRQILTSVIPITPRAAFPPSTAAITPIVITVSSIFDYISIAPNPSGSISVTTNTFGSPYGTITVAALVIAGLAHSVPLRCHLLNSRESLPRRLLLSSSLAIRPDLRHPSLPLQPLLLLLRTLTFSASLLTARHLPHRLATLLPFRSLLLPLLSLLTLNHHLLATRFLLLPHLLHHLPTIGSLLLLRPLPTTHLLPLLGLWSFLPLPTTTHLALLRRRALPPLLLPAAHLLPLGLCRTLLTLLLLSRLRLRSFLTLRLLTLNLLLASSPISSAAILTAVPSSPALPEHIGAGPYKCQ